jgi:hypothetical protein
VTDPAPATVCGQCVTRVHHPHHGHPTCGPDAGDDCEAYLWCNECWQPWPCSTKTAHVAARRAARTTTEETPCP